MYQSDLQIKQEQEPEDSSSDDEFKLFKSLQQDLPPANALIVRQQIHEFVVRTVYPQPFKCTPEFNKDLTPLQETISVSATKHNDPITEQTLTLFDYYENNRNKLVYIKYEDLKFQYQSPSRRLYFASILTDLRGNLPKLIYQGLPTECRFSTQTQIFDSNFESGNLFCAFKVGENEYDLMMQNDFNTRGNTQWFFFRMTGQAKGTIVKFNIINHVKTGSLFNDGLKPAVFSVKAKETNGVEWTRQGQDISYYRNNLMTFVKNYTLTFSYEFQYDDDTVYFAHSYPYTYTDLMKYMISNISDRTKASFMTRKVVCKSLLGNDVEVITITNSCLSRRNHRKGVIFLARQHPGEPQGSYVMQGVIDYLTSPEAEQLRQNCIFKIFPMVNPDGVILGNYRCGLEGNDFNRRWRKPNKRIHPQIYYIKKYIREFAKQRPILLLCDLHGHSRKQGTFFYGCSFTSLQKSMDRVFALLASKISQKIQYSSCTFRVERAKDKTARIQLWRELKMTWAYTYECSFFGQNGLHYSIKDYMECGKDLCRSLDEIVSDSIKKKTNTSGPSLQQQILDEMDKIAPTDNDDEGSDSQPSEDELSDDEIVNLLPQQVLSIKQKALLQAQIHSQQSSVKSQVQVQQKPRNLFVAVKKPEKPNFATRNPTPQILIQRRTVHITKTQNLFSPVPVPPVKPLMVDKACQTDDYLYKDWLLRMRRQKREEQMAITQSKSPQRQRHPMMNNSPLHQSSLLFQKDNRTYPDRGPKAFPLLFK